MVKLDLSPAQLELLKPLDKLSPEQRRQLKAGDVSVKLPSFHRKLSWPLKLSLAYLALVIVACVSAPLWCTHVAQDFFLEAINHAPNGQFWAGTDYLGRDIFTLLWYGGRSSLLIGALAALTAAILGGLIGIVAALSSDLIDNTLQRILELLQSVPSILYMLVLSAWVRPEHSWSLALLIGACTWVAVARLVRAQVRTLRSATFWQAACAMGAGFTLKLRLHILPGLISTQSFILAAAFVSALTYEATLTFLGLGLPPEELSWGALLALSNRALLTNSWWVIVFPGLMLLSVLTAVSIICFSLQKPGTRRCSNL